MGSKKVSAFIINYQTPELTQQAVSSFRRFYPDIFLVLIDNGSRDNSVQFLKNNIHPYSHITKFVVNSKNIHHGPAMHQAMQIAESEFILFLDSDCIVIEGGFIEKMIEVIESDANNYAVGKMVFMNKRGFDVKQNGYKYIRPICMLVRREMYFKINPFERHGTPCLKNMISAVNRRYNLMDFEIEKYIFHKGRGTASLHGYNLGLKGKINHIFNKLGI